MNRLAEISITIIIQLASILILGPLIKVFTLISMFIIRLPQPILIQIIISAITILIVVITISKLKISFSSQLMGSAIIFFFGYITLFLVSGSNLLLRTRLIDVVSMGVIWFMIASIFYFKSKNSSLKNKR
ncbi:MAG: hypothetical protein AABW71_00500 [Nanoarchaeota archaeon]